MESFEGMWGINIDELIIPLPAEKYSQDQIRLILTSTSQPTLKSINISDGKLSFKFSPYKLGEDAAPYTNTATAICDEIHQKVRMLKIRDQILAIRATGMTNMFDLKVVQILSNERDFYELVLFIEDQPGDYTKFILSGVLAGLSNNDIQHTVITGRRVILDSMPDDLNPVMSGTAGTVVGFDDCDHILVDWDDGRSLNLIPGVVKYV